MQTRKLGGTVRETDMQYRQVSGIVVALCLALAAQAHEQTGEARSFYTGLAFGFTESNSGCDYYGYNCSGYDNSIKFLGGKRLHENFALELAYLDLGKLDNRNDSLTTTAESSGLNLSLVGIIPLDYWGYLYGKVGTMAWETDYVRIDEATRTGSSDDGTDLTYGFGFALAFRNKYEFRIEFERLNELDDRFTPGGDSITQFSFAGVINLD